jgi:hypothetical protein
MSDARVRTALEQMEAWLADPQWEPDADGLAQWHAEFREALAHAEKATGWPSLIDRAHAAGQALEDRTAPLAEERDRLKAMLEGQGRGVQALKSYGASTR